MHNVVRIGGLVLWRRYYWELFGYCCMGNVSRRPNLSEQGSGRTEETISIFVILDFFIGCDHREARRGTNNRAYSQTSPLSLWSEKLCGPF
jgi:hypothetical protein